MASTNEPNNQNNGAEPGLLRFDSFGVPSSTQDPGGIPPEAAENNPERPQTPQFSTIELQRIPEEQEPPVRLSDHLLAPRNRSKNKPLKPKFSKRRKPNRTMVITLGQSQGQSSSYQNQLPMRNRTKYNEDDYEEDDRLDINSSDYQNQRMRNRRRKKAVFSVIKPNTTQKIDNISKGLLERYGYEEILAMPKQALFRDFELEELRSIVRMIGGPWNFIRHFQLKSKEYKKAFPPVEREWKGQSQPGSLYQLNSQTQKNGLAELVEGNLIREEERMNPYGKKTSFDYRVDDQDQAVNSQDADNLNHLSSSRYALTKKTSGKEPFLELPAVKVTKIDSDQYSDRDNAPRFANSGEFGRSRDTAKSGKGEKGGPKNEGKTRNDKSKRKKRRKKSAYEMGREELKKWKRGLKAQYPYSRKQNLDPGHPIQRYIDQNSKYRYSQHPSQKESSGVPSEPENLKNPTHVIKNEKFVPVKKQRKMKENIDPNNSQSPIGSVSQPRRYPLPPNRASNYAKNQQKISYRQHIKEDLAFKKSIRNQHPEASQRSRHSKNQNSSKFSTKNSKRSGSRKTRKRSKSSTAKHLETIREIVQSIDPKINMKGLNEESGHLKINKLSHPKTPIKIDQSQVRKLKIDDSNSQDFTPMTTSRKKSPFSEILTKPFISIEKSNKGLAVSLKQAFDQQIQIGVNKFNLGSARKQNESRGAKSGRRAQNGQERARSKSRGAQASNGGKNKPRGNKLTINLSLRKEGKRAQRLEEKNPLNNVFRVQRGRGDKKSSRSTSMTPNKQRKHWTADSASKNLADLDSSLGGEYSVVRKANLDLSNQNKVVQLQPIQNEFGGRYMLKKGRNPSFGFKNPFRVTPEPHKGSKEAKNGQMINGNINGKSWVQGLLRQPKKHRNQNLNIKNNHGGKSKGERGNQFKSIHLNQAIIR